MSDIKISVILPVYNVEKYLTQCLDSIVNQTLKEIEIICVDDGSTDNSLKILNEYAAKDARIRVVRQANGGAGAARNNGMALASGDYLLFLDSDDFFELNMLETAYALAVKERSDIVVFDSDQYLEDNGAFKKVSSNIRRKAIPPYSPFDHYLFTDNTFRVFIGWAWDKLFKADFVRRHHLSFQEQRTTNDLLFVFSAIVLAERISVADTVLAHQRRNLKNSLSNTRERSWNCFYDALVALRENLVSYNLMNELEQDYINYALYFSLWNLETLKGPQKEALYNKLKNEWFAALGIADKQADYFYEKEKYKEFLVIKNKAFADYLSANRTKRRIKSLKQKLRYLLSTVRRCILR